MELSIFLFLVNKLKIHHIAKLNRSYSTYTVILKQSFFYNDNFLKYRANNGM